MAQFVFRLPDDVYEELKKAAEAEAQSINQWLVDTVQVRIRHARARRAMEGLGQIRAEVKIRHGVLPDSSAEIRGMREDRS